MQAKDDMNNEINPHKLRDAVNAKNYRYKHTKIDMVPQAITILQ